MEKQPSQLDLPFRLPLPLQQSRRHILLGNRVVTYALTRGRRRNVGMTIDHRGLRVGAPRHLSHDDIEGFIRSHGAWVLRKLDDWQRSCLAPKVVLRDGEQIPLMGDPVSLRVRSGANRVRFEASEIVLEARREADLPMLLSRGLRDYARELFRGRLALFAPAIARPVPRLTLSSAQTRWGSCSEKSGIRLNWRLVHLPLRLVDYVVVHEVAHLVEMNHSPRFWTLVERLYPDYRAAQAQLRSCAGNIPNF